jgi:hypothetical protein
VSDAALLAALVALEREGWQALVDGTAAAFYERVLAPDALLVVPGTVLDGATWLGSLDGPAWATFTIDDERVVVLTSECAALVYRATAQRRGEPTYHALVTSTYRRDGGAWRLVLHQQTPRP